MVLVLLLAMVWKGFLLARQKCHFHLDIRWTGPSAERRPPPAAIAILWEVAAFFGCPINYTALLLLMHLHISLDRLLLRFTGNCCSLLVDSLHIATVYSFGYYNLKVNSIDYYIRLETSPSRTLPPSLSHVMNLKHSCISQVEKSVNRPRTGQSVFPVQTAT